MQRRLVENRRGAVSTRGLPLDGVRVVDVGTFVAGPYSASILSEFGAEVYKVEHPLGDYMVGLYGAIGVMLALRYKEQTGRGQYIDIGTYEAVFRQLDELSTAYGFHGKIREREGAGTVIACPHGHFRTKDDKWVAFACTNDKLFAALAEAMERPELASHALYGANTPGASKRAMKSMRWSARGAAR